MINFLEIGFFVLLGILLRYSRVDTKKLVARLNFAAVYISVPALVLLTVPQLRVSRETVALLLAPWGLLCCSAIAVLLLARIYGWSRPVIGTLLMVVPLGNTGFMGVPIVNAFLGEAGIPYLIVYDQLGTLLILLSYGTYITARYGEGGSRIEYRLVLKRALLFPPMLAFIVALLLHGVVLPELLILVLKPVAAVLTPLVMTAIGLQLTLRLKSSVLLPFAYGMAIKLVFAPLLIHAFLSMFGLRGLAYDVCVLLAGMPPMITAAVLAVSARLDAELAVAMSGLGIVLAFITLPLIHALLI